jgi:comEA protein
MPVFNRSEQLILLLLASALVIGAGVRVTDSYFSDLEDFHVIKGAVQPPIESLPGETGKDVARSTASPAHQAALPLNLNSATLEQLTTLPGIGPRTAERILERRESNGPFHQVSDLTKVKGIGKRTLERLLPHITVGEAGNPAGGPHKGRTP